jgi:glycosyltransferase involved in cell wall biosynthesis
MRILIVSFTFPPYEVIGAVRVGKVAKYLDLFGHDVRVVTARDQSVRSAEGIVEIDGGKVTYTQWVGIRRVADRVLGRGASLETRDRSPVVGRLLRWVRTLAYFPDPYAGWLPFAYKAARNICYRWRPDLILASSGPPTALMVASLLSRRFGVPWVADMRDLWTENQTYTEPAWRRRIEAFIERRVLRSAAGLVTVSEPLAERLRRFNRPVEIVLNGFDTLDVAERNRWTSELSVVFTGTVYPEYQDPAPLFAALALLGSQKDRVSVTFVGTVGSGVLAAARAHGVDHLVKLESPVPLRRSLSLQREADVLLHLLWNDPDQSGVYNAKIFEYFGARRPILAIGSGANVTARLVRERNAGFATNDPAAIATQLRTWLALKEGSAGIPDLPEEVRYGLSREEQTRVLDVFLERLVREKATA